jgi:conjugative transfer signal peptidase TraF
MSRSAILLAMALAGTGVLFPGRTALHPKLVWNASASVPIGFYLIDSNGPFLAGDLVAIEPSGSLARYLADRAYLPKGVLLLKRILAVSGETVCREGQHIAVDGIEVGAALERDHAGRDLPRWRGCRPIPVDAVFLMNRSVRDSLDGRYFGLTSAHQIIGRAVPLWTDEQGDRRFQWRARAR